MSKYKHIYIDLDRTLWDFEANANEAFRDIFNIYNLGNIIPDFEKFVETYIYYNELLWNRYSQGKIKKELLRTERFRLTLNRFNISDAKFTKLISESYMEITPQKSILVDGAIETLEYLKTKYSLYILTNGFPEVQYTKIRNSGLDSYFAKIITSEDAGRHKPHRRIFEYALKSVNAKKNESIMIGDNLENDILGAKNVGMDQVFFNKDNIKHDYKITFEINQFRELIRIL